VKNLTTITDYFVICSGTSSRQIKTIADEIVEKLKKKDIKPFHFEADNGYEWVVVDYVNVIVHIFSEEKRENYRLERLWGDAQQINVE
jgi:ribosome-associated protein